ncbi:MAG: ornithine decarboxylase [Acidimicrobiia bacterium]|nr:ornithine decarboxylase [Acidimicrobiia bacterium]
MQDSLQYAEHVARYWPHSAVQISSSHNGDQHEPATPFLMVDCDVVRSRYQNLVRALPGFRTHFAVKCNPSPRIIRAIVNQGGSFEIASLAELQLVTAQGARASEVLYSNPVKPAAHIAAARAAGVRRFAFDSESELRKLAHHAPGAEVYVRLAVDDHNSLFPLSAKFGTSIDEAERLLLMTYELGLVPLGVTFHVGSQCLDVTAWAAAIGRVGILLRRMLRHGVRLEMLDIGGGFPARYVDGCPSIDRIGTAIAAAIASLPYRPATLVSEPGRYLVAEAGTMVATVIGVADRNGQRWVYLDVGGYNGLMEAVQTGGRWAFPISTSAHGDALIECTVTGPSCDSSDTMFYGVSLPNGITDGDRLVIGCAGAYSLSYASSFNGFPPPNVAFRNG